MESFMDLLYRVRLSRPTARFSGTGCSGHWREHEQGELPMSNAEGEPVYYNLIIVAASPAKEIWLGDDAGHLVQMEAELAAGPTCSRPVPKLSPE
jgi:hypothetical protein